MLGAASLGGIVQAGAVAPSPGQGRPTQPPVEQFLDLDFGTAGRTDTPGFGGDRTAMALQADGSIVMAGGTFVDFVLARFSADGALDTTFGDAGFVTTDIGGDVQEEALAVAIDPEGRIVAAGYSGFDATLAIARYAPDGSLDPSFGTGGLVVGTVPGRGYAVAVAPDGSIIVGGEAAVTDSATDYADLLLARFGADGTLDTDFGDAGRVVIDASDVTNTVRNLVLLADGSIVASGEPYGDPVGSNYTDVAKLTPDGSLDPAFGDGGVTSIAGSRVGEGLAVAPDGWMALAGQAPDAGSTDFAVMRLLADGSVDPTFGSAGQVVTDVDGQRDWANAVAVTPDGRIVAAGGSGDFNTDFAVVRYLPDGTLDPDFANGGTLLVDFHLLVDIAESVALQPDGKIVLGGLAGGAQDGYGVARALP
jgi:uncharacterized delta-60 repeat protein